MLKNILQNITVPLFELLIESFLDIVRSTVFVQLLKLFIF